MCGVMLREEVRRGESNGYKCICVRVTKDALEILRDEVKTSDRNN